MKHIFYLLLSTAIAIVTLTGCINDDFTTSPSDVLAFSADTVKFDTVITKQGTATKQFVIYNKSNKQLNISSIQVAGTSDAKFYLNVDGTKGNEFHNIEVRGKDSIYVFVEGYIDELSKDEPTEFNDRIDFETNGVKQSVVLNAWGQDVVRLSHAVIDHDTHFTAHKPYLIYDSLTIEENATLTIDPGATLLFHDKAWLKALGTVKAMGTQEKPISLRGDRLDHVVGGISFDIMSSQWGGVALMGYNNEFNYVDMHSSAWGLQVASQDPTQRSLRLFNSVLHNSGTQCLLATNAWVEAEGTEFSDAPEGVATFIAGKVRISQCTFANYYLFKAIKGANIVLFNQDEAGQFAPMDCRIDNSISYGLGLDINDIASEKNIMGTNIYFHNVLFKSKGSDDTHFFNCVWEGDPKFKVNRDKYIFDYRLNNDSHAIAKGDRSLCPKSARYDRFGNDRFARDGIDLGAYAWVAEPQAKNQ